MKLKSIILAALAAILSCAQAFGQASILPPGETCFSALAPTSGGPSNTGTGFIGLLGTITGGAGYTNGTYGGVPLTGGSGTNATANITVAGGIVTQVAILNPGVTYVAGDVLSAAAANIGGTGSGFSVGIASVSINFSLAGGSVGFYIPNTLSIKQTWQDAGQATLNQNPVLLDANGCAVIYGAGIYRQILKDSLGNTVWDKLTAATNGSNGIFWASIAGGTGNAITVTNTAFANQDGYNLQFLAKAANTGPATIAVSGGTPIAIVNDTSVGPAALTGGEIGPGNTPMLTYDAANVEFHIVNPASTSSATTSSSLVPPQGYLNLVGQASGDVIQAGDVVATSTVYYSPFVGANLPIWNGATFVQTAFSELTATLTAAGSPLGSIQDACVFSNNGAPTLAIGPAWTTATAGSGNRGSGAGTAQITRLQGIWVNAVQITGYNGLSSFTIGANRCTYVGSLSIDGTAGQVSAYRTWGQNRKFGIWNAYNRTPIYMQAGDSTAGWTNAAAVYPTFRAANAAAANSITTFTGLAEEEVFTEYSCQAQTVVAARIGYIGIGVNSTTAASGNLGYISNASGGTSGSIRANNIVVPTIGINTITALESTNSSASFSGTQPFMQLITNYRG